MTRGPNLSAILCSDGGLVFCSCWLLELKLSKMPLADIFRYDRCEVLQ